MADDYIDYLEVGEYGGHFVEEAQKLVGASKLVDVEELRTLIGNAVEKVAVELEAAGVKRSDMRTSRGSVETATEAARKEIDRFYSFLGSLDDDVKVDKAAFFPGNKLGALAALKPADLKGKLDDLARGFSAPANAALPDRAKWEQKLTGARDALGGALVGKGGARGLSIKSTAGLIAAREGFLKAYNGVAKRLIQGLLASLGREGEMKLFFSDLVVHESGKARAPSAGEGAPAQGDGAAGQGATAGGDRTGNG